MNTKTFAVSLLAALTLAGVSANGNTSADAVNSTASPERESAAVAAPVSDYLERLELRSVVRLPGGPMFGLRDPAENNTFWIEPGQRRHDLQVEAFDSEGNRLTLRHGDSVRTLSLSSVRIQALPEESRDDVASRADNAVNATPRTEVSNFLERWRAATQASSELQEIEGHFREVVGRILDVNARLSEADENSEGHRRLLNERNELNREFAVLQRVAVQTLNNHPDFGEFDPRIIPQVIRYTNGFQLESDR